MPELLIRPPYDTYLKSDMNHTEAKLDAALEYAWECGKSIGAQALNSDKQFIGYYEEIVDIANAIQTIKEKMSELNVKVRDTLKERNKR